MDFIAVYKCLCDRQRLRILNLLRDGPLCVCHLMEILELEQVKVSKQLRYMKELGLVEAERAAQWMIYRLADEGNPLLEANLACLQDCLGEETGFREDLARRKAVMERVRNEGPACLNAVND